MEHVVELLQRLVVDGERTAVPLEVDAHLEPEQGAEITFQRQRVRVLRRGRPGLVRLDAVRRLVCLLFMRHR